MPTTHWEKRFATHILVHGKGLVSRIHKGLTLISKRQTKLMGKWAWDKKSNSEMRKPELPICKNAKAHYNQKNKNLKHEIPFHIHQISNIKKLLL